MVEAVIAVEGLASILVGVSPEAEERAGTQAAGLVLTEVAEQGGTPAGELALIWVVALADTPAGV